jgi:predicted enzyme related to lactoylglutathione lyase
MAMKNNNVGGLYVMNITFADICFITDDVLRLRTFYESVFNCKAEGDAMYSTMGIDNVGITFLAQKNPAFYHEITGSAGNVILSFNTNNIDIAYQQILSLGIHVPREPITHPWGARSFKFNDPDGNIINFRSL